MNHSEFSSARYLQHEGAVCSPSSDGAVIYSPAKGAYYAVNEVATSIWNHLDSPATASQIVESLLAEYDAPQDAIGKDVRSTLKYLESLGLIAQVNS